MFDKRRLIIGVITGAILGVICVLGAQVRSGFGLSFSYLFVFWFNRVLLGLFIGLLSSKMTLDKLLIRGAIIGLIVSFSFYSATDFNDFVGFFAGIIYGVIIEYTAYRFKKQ
ncbi:MAG: hypothetical protein K9L64_04870 [Candidatus Izimaplasma sp.]|nr:hypothetical protein [Candidatus Izimaplasma bacterium]